MSGDYERLEAKLKNHKQDHLLKFWDRLNSTEKKSLTDQIDAIDLTYIAKCFNKCNEDLKNSTRCSDDDIKPIPDSVLGRVVEIKKEKLDEYRNEGLKQISEGKVALLLLAGGQGTRLGVPYPKGMYNVGLPSNKTLYQLMAEKLIRLQKLAGQISGKSATIPWYIMTSEMTHQQTEEFFQKNKYFGLEKNNIIFFDQGYMPCVDFDGNILMDSICSIAKAPDGNGGLYSALQRNKIIDDFDRRGIEYIHAYCVDNLLVKVADPSFIGFCLSLNANCGAKVVEKLDPTEPVGVICRYKNKYHVMEYSEISKNASELRIEGSDRLVFNAGGIANHFFSVDFLKKVISQEHLLQHHVAKKKIPHIDENGNLLTPKTPNGIKMEKFIFDVFQFSEDFAVWEVIRSDEFAPLKNADSAGVDCPSTCRAAVFDLHKKWIEAAGGRINMDENKGDSKKTESGLSAVGHMVCEVSPLVSYEGEGLEEYVKDKELIVPILIISNEEQHKNPQN